LGSQSKQIGPAQESAAGSHARPPADTKGWSALPFGKGHRWLSSSNRAENAFVSGWTLTGLVLYTSGQPFNTTVDDPYYAGWAQLYPNYNVSNFSGASFHQSQYVRPDPVNNPYPAGDFYLPANLASAPANGQLGTGPQRISALRCPGLANENASILKYFSMGSDGQYKLSFRAEFYNLFNRHTWGINGCASPPYSHVGSPTFGMVTGVNSSPRTGQFAVRFTF